MKLIANFGNGVDNLDLVTAREENVTVTNTPDVLTEDTADLVLTLVLMISRKVVQAQKKISGGRWSGWGPSETMGERIRGKNFGIIGMGRIGRAVAKRAKSFNMEMVFDDFSFSRLVENFFYQELFVSFFFEYHHGIHRKS